MYVVGKEYHIELLKLINFNLASPTYFYRIFVQTDLTSVFQNYNTLLPSYEYRRKLYSAQLQNGDLFSNEM